MDGGRHCINYYSERGKIQNRERARQIIDFSGIRYGNITPTDVDGLIEYHDKGIAFLEYKYGDTELPFGQRLALTRIADNIQKAGENSTVLVCEHYVEDCNQDIQAEKAIVRELYFAGRWYHDGKREVKDVLDGFISFCDEDRKPF